MRNKIRKSAMRTAVKSTKVALEKGDKESAQKAFVTAQSLLARLGKSTAMNKKTTARLTSRLARKINKA